MSTVTFDLIERELRRIPIEKLFDVYQLIHSLSIPLVSSESSSRSILPIDQDPIVGMFAFPSSFASDNEDILNREITKSGWTWKDRVP